MQFSPLSPLAFLGQCGESVFRWIPRALHTLWKAAVRFLHDFAHGCMRVLRLIGRMLRQPILLHSEAAEEIRREWKRPKNGSVTGWIASVLRMLGTVLLSETGVLYPLARFAVPAACCGILFAVVSHTINQSYDIAVTLNGEPIGKIAEEQDYIRAEEIVRKRLSYTAEASYEINFARSLRLETYDGYSPILNAGELADKMLRSQNIALIDGCGVYVNGEFAGAVRDQHPVEEALTQNLSRYANALGKAAEDVWYADEITYERGTYLAENLTDTSELIRKLTAVTRKKRTYTAGASETIYSVADRFTTTPETIRALNPELEDLIPVAMRVTVPVETHYLPILYTKTAVTYTAIPYDSETVDTAELPVGTSKVLRRGENGEKQNTVRITYTDGAETGRTTLKTTLLSPPVDEVIGKGTYAAKPYSTDTVIDGDGRYLWPVDGGRITDVFGGTRNHRGIDIGAAEGSYIFAGAAGVVRYAGWNDSYGNFVIVDHQDGYETLYAHSCALLVEAGQQVQSGQVIALVGTTGHSTGPHLHFEVRINGVNYNPMLFLHVNAG